MVACNLQQSRTFMGWFRKKAEVTTVPEVPEVPAEPLLDLEMVSNIVDMSTGLAADHMAWSTIHQGVTYPTYAAQPGICFLDQELQPWERCRHVRQALRHTSIFQHTDLMIILQNRNISMQLLLGGLHDYGCFGQPLQWPLAILAAVLIMRTCTAPLLIMQMKSSYNMGKAKPLLEELQKGLMAKIQKGERLEDAQAWYMKEMYKVWDKHNSNPLYALTPMVVNLPIFLGMYWGMMTMCDGGLPSLALDSAFWVPDLTKPDPTHVLQLAVPATLWCQIQLGAVDGLEGMSPEMRQGFLWVGRIMPVLLIPLLWNFQAAICLYWTYSNLFSIAFTGVLRWSSMRKLVGLPSRKEMIELQIQNAKRAAANPAATDMTSWMKNLPSFSSSSASTAASPPTIQSSQMMQAASPLPAPAPRSKAQLLRAAKPRAHRKASA